MANIDDIANNAVKKYLDALQNPIRMDGKANPDVSLRSVIFQALSTMAADAYYRGIEEGKRRSNIKKA